MQWSDGAFLDQKTNKSGASLIFNKKKKSKVVGLRKIFVKKKKKSKVAGLRKFFLEKNYLKRNSNYPPSDR